MVQYFLFLWLWHELQLLDDLNWSCRYYYYQRTEGG